MKKTAVIGLGIIGGSLCAALTVAGYEVHGFDLDASCVEYALRERYICGVANDFSLYDTVFIAVPPKATLWYLENGKFKDGAIVSDICGVKEIVEKTVRAKKRNYRYIGLHPMAGKETSGIASATPNLFKNANLIVTRSDDTSSEALEEIKRYAGDIGFGRIVECSAKEHDKKIALTSQLAHIVSNAYVKSSQVKGCDGFTGGSFQDMTRIAGVDECVWTPLYACNRKNIVFELNGLIERLSVYRDALEEGDDNKLSETLKEGRLIRETIKRGND